MVFYIFNKSSIVYAFFHQTARDETFLACDNNSELNQNIELANKVTGQIKIKFKFEHKMFQIAIFYARYLVKENILLYSLV